MTDTIPIPLGKAGLDLFELSLAGAVDRNGKKGSMEVLSAMARGVPAYQPASTYAALCALSHDYLMPLPLIVADGNMGLWSEPAAPPEYTRCSLSPSAKHALKAEQSGEAPIPFDLINGDLHRGGSRPPLDPRTVAMLLAGKAGSDPVKAIELNAMWTPANAQADGDWPKLFAGEKVKFAFYGRVALIDGQLVVNGIPPGSDPRPLEMQIHSRTGRKSLDMSGPSGPRIQVSLKPDDDAESIARQILEIPAMTSHMELNFGTSILDIVEAWISAHGDQAASRGSQKLLKLVA